MSEPALPRGWAYAFPQELAADEPNALGIGPFGSNLKVSDYTESGVPLVFVRNIRSGSFDEDIHFVTPYKAEKLSAHKVHPGDVLITKMGDPPGDSALYPHNRPVGIVTADCIKWRIAPAVGVAEFFVYATRAPSVQRQIQTITSGVAQKKVSLERFRTVNYPVAPISEQQRIIDELDSYFTRLDDTVVTLERVQRNLKRYRASVLKAAVEGRLVPTEAELARAEKRDYEPASELLRRILAERRRRWDRKGKYEEPAAPDASNLPELPEGWCWASVDQLSCDVRYGTSAKCSENVSEGVPVLRMGNIADGKLNLDKLKYLPVDHDEFPDLLLEPGDLLFNRTNSAELVGKSAVYQGRPPACAFASYLIRVRFLPGVEAELVAANLNSPMGRNWIASVAVQQVGQANVNGTKLKAYPIPLPPAAEQMRVVEEMNRLFSVLEDSTMSVDANRQRCNRLRQSILKWAFEGKLVDQDPNDEPASALLERIRAQKTARTK